MMASRSGVEVDRDRQGWSAQLQPRPGREVREPLVRQSVGASVRAGEVASFEGYSAKTCPIRFRVTHRRPSVAWCRCMRLKCSAPRSEFLACDEALVLGLSSSPLGDARCPSRCQGRGVIQGAVLRLRE